MLNASKILTVALLKKNVDTILYKDTILSAQFETNGHSN